ncbi:hypothetical protein BDQ12DRAFT_710926 [Crucibulum laeve]|uniref:Peroxisomal membrane protein PEX14 n=1 Tax=Crucibulum laeve TaxID=68775 RepID=A0A5C3M8S4_9AGAR|nr:hypothetical protein BDQ12DRAFT_710926 [Crucibulum laeve]
MASSDRQELIRNAVIFLSDPKTQASPLTQRIQFLEAKGLTPPEVDIALKQAAANAPGPSRQPSYGPAYAPNPYALAGPLPQRWDWRDYFITAVVSGTVAYGGIALFKKYLLPHLQPPTSTAYEEDRDALNAQFDAAEALLREIQSETAAVRAAVEDQKEKIEKTTSDVDAVVIQMREGETKTRDEMREIREEVNTIREMLPKAIIFRMIEKNKESQTQSLSELQQELKSLKALLLSRGPTVSSTPSTPLPMLGRPSIPAWQLASPAPVNGGLDASAVSTPAPALNIPSISNGKGKEVETFGATFCREFRQAVENLAQVPQPRRGSDASEDPHDSASRSRSLDLHGARPSSPLSSGKLAESAMVNLRKSLATQRSGGASPSPRSGSPVSVPETRTPKSRLEERLRRATLAIGEVSATTATEPPVRPSSSTASLPKTLVARHPLSPSLLPLPQSPMLTPTVENEFVLDGQSTSSQSDPPTLTTNTTPHLLSSKPEITSPESQSVTETSSPEPQSVADATLTEPRSVTEISLSDTQSIEVASSPESHSLAESTLPTAEITQEITESPSDDRIKNQESPDLTVNRVNVEELQERLKQIEQRFTDVSTSFKRLQAEKLAADTVLRELTPLESIQDHVALKDYLRSMAAEAEMFQGELKRLNGKLASQDDRIEELRDTHRLESKSQSEQIEKLRTQLVETEALFQASQSSTAEAEETAAKNKVEFDRLQTEIERLKTVAKEEEEKRVKAISLLKTVRQKLVKAEKEREDAVSEAASLKGKEQAGKDQENAERERLLKEIEAISSEKEKAEAGLKAYFEREIANTKERYEKDISALKGQFELDVVTAKDAHAKELGFKNTNISALESSLNNVTRDKNAFFDQLQLRQAELESAHAHIESLEHQNTELKFELRESSERLAMMKEEFSEMQREQANRSREPATSAGEIAQLISATEAKYESKVSELKRNLTTLEKERNEGEADWSRKLREKVKELEDLRKTLSSAAKIKEEHDTVVAGLEAEIARINDERRLLREHLSDVPALKVRMTEVEQTARLRIEELNSTITFLEQQVEEYKNREAQLRQNNKTIREELRKVQSSAALLERQRNPGVGYWTSRAGPDNGSTITRTSISSSPSESTSRVGSPVPSSTTSTSNKNEEEVNLEYLRNVILQFLEHKEMRPNLVKVLSIILHFTPQETRRLIAKV